MARPGRSSLGRFRTCSDLLVRFPTTKNVVLKEGQSPGYFFPARQVLVESDMGRRTFCHFSFIFALLLFGICVVYFSPVLLDPHHRIAGGKYDPLFIAYVVDWVGESVFTGDLWNPPFFYPEKNVLAYSDHLVGLGILFLPLRILSDSPGLLANTILFLAFLLTGLTTYMWLKDLFADDWASAAGAIGFSFASWRMVQLSHPQLLFIPFLPLFLLISRRTDSDQTSYLLLWSASALLALQTLCTPSLAIYFIPLVAMWTLLRALLSRSASLKLWGKQALLFSLPVGVNLPLAFRYWATTDGQSFTRSLAEVRSFSAQWIDWISAPRAHWLYSDVLDFTHGMERELFPGFIPAAVLVTGGVSLLFCSRSQKRTFSGFLLVALIALWASGGPSEKGGFTLLRLPYDLIYNLVPGGDQVRVPARFALLAGLFLSPIYTLGWAKIFEVIRGDGATVKRLDSHVLASSFSPCWRAFPASHFTEP